MPGAFPGSPIEQDTPTQPSKRSRMTEAATPVSAAPIQAPTEEMHPKHLHQSTAKPREEARWLGFSNMPPATEPPKRNAKHVEAQATPSRTTKQENAFKSPDFTFTFRREQSLELSPEAKQLMDEKRAEALLIKEQMRSIGEAAQMSGDAFGRKIAQPKGKKSRFSELHDAQFQKMDSIAGHASAYRKDPSRLAAQTPGSKVPVQTPSKSLKRSPSKAELDKNEATPSRTIPRTTSKPNLAQPASQLRRAPSMKNLREPATEDATPAKRVKRTETQDVSNARPSSSSSDKALLSTPQHIKDSRQQPSYPDLTHLATPTQSSLARAGSVKSTKVTSKIPGPSLVRSPSKPTLVEPSKDSPKPATNLMARSPVKAGIFGNSSSPSKPATSGSGKEDHEDRMPLLSRSPTKSGLFSHTHTAVDMSSGALEEKPKSMMDAALARTPAKAGIHKHARLDQDNSPSPQKKEPQAPLLARSPLKMSVSKAPEAEQPTSQKQSSIPLLSQSPSKASQSNNPFTSAVEQTPNVKSTGSNLFGRFNMLRGSPIKSILRTPQRLYSNDPSKIAAGTHFSTPPKHGDTKNSKEPGPPPATAPVRKRVDFSSSTKDHDAIKMDISSDEPSSPVEDEATSTVPAAGTANYPTLPTIFSPVVNPTPERRRQTVAPGDFTFRAGDGILFGDRLAPPASAKAASSIRHVSAEPDIVPSTVAASQKKRKFDFENKMNANPAELSPTVTPGSKKRKFAFENNAIAKTAEVASASDKENGGEEEVEDEDSSRPAKRVKSAAATTSKVAAKSSKSAAPKPAPKKASRMPTLGVKPKAGSAGATAAAAAAAAPKEEKKKSTASITMARLNALAMPKRRG